jgi:hypothetical protein
LLDSKETTKSTTFFTTRKRHNLSPVDLVEQDAPLLLQAQEPQAMTCIMECHSSSIMRTRIRHSQHINQIFGQFIGTADQFLGCRLMGGSME